MNLPAEQIDHKFLWYISIGWVNKNRTKICGFAKRYQVFTGYDIQDYLNQAYVIAFETLSKLQSEQVDSNNGSNKFIAYFWVSFKWWCFKVSSCSYVDPEKFKVKYYSETEDKSETASSDDIKLVLDTMTSSQRRVWDKCFEVGGSHALVSRELGLSIDRVKKLKRYGVRRALKFLNPEEQAY